MILIDDVTVIHQLSNDLPHPSSLCPLWKGQEVRTTRKKSPDGVDREWEVSVGRGVTIRYCAELHQVEVRLSIPRLAYPSRSRFTSNFPLARTLPDFRPVSRAMVKALRLDTSLNGVPPGDFFELLDWPVRRVAYAIDVTVGDVTGAISAVQNLHRAGNSVQSWGSPPHSCQWDAEHYRFMVYSKEHEIRARPGQLPSALSTRRDFEKAGREFRAQLAKKAQGVVRLETTLRSKALREPWKLEGGWLPSLGTVLKDEVGAYFIGSQLRRLNLDAVPVDDEHEHEQGADQSKLPVDPAALSFMFDEAIAKFERAGKRLPSSGGKKISGARLSQLLAVYQNSGVIDDDTLCRINRMGKSTLSARRRDLRALGLLSVASPEPHRQQCLRELVARVRDVLPSWPSNPPPLAKTDFRTAPWIDMLDTPRAARMRTR